MKTFSIELLKVRHSKRDGELKGGTKYSVVTLIMYKSLLLCLK